MKLGTGHPPLIGQAEALARLLLSEGLVTEQQLAALQHHQRTNGEPFADALVSLGYVTAEAVAQARAKLLNVPHQPLKDYPFEQKILGLVPEHTARRHQVVPLSLHGRTLTVAMVNPLDVIAIDEVARLTGCEIAAVLSSKGEINKAISQHYAVSHYLQDLVSRIEDQPGALLEEAREVSISSLEQRAGENPVVNLINLLIAQAIREGASDIHIEPMEHRLRVRQRVDGLLHETTSPPKHLQYSIASRIKIMGEMDIAETRAPQDGRVRINFHGKRVDLRISVLPGIHGEVIVIRLLDQSRVLVGLDNTGMLPDTRELYERVIRKPYGMIFVTGPTGSGKSTTLYASLSEIKSVEKNIITVEDPVEYMLQGVRQHQVNPKANLTFANALRSILRQDPDIIMVGEVRDRETAQIAIQAALTGHLVFSTLHTNDAAGSLTRLLDMGVEPFLISSSVEAVLAQRLVRSICPNCKEGYEADLELLKSLNLDRLAELQVSGVKDGRVFLYRGAGCRECKQTGYKGRAGVYELLILDDLVGGMVLSGRSAAEIKKAVREGPGMRTLREDGLLKVLRGDTTLDEVIRVTMEDAS